MMPRKIVTDYWLTIEPYVYVSTTNRCILLYNTLDGGVLESDKIEVIELLRELIKEENCGIVLLKNERFKQEDIKKFIGKLREKYMGDIIDVALSKGKPVQLLPFYNYPNKHEIYKKHHFSPLKGILQNLSEISIYVDHTVNTTKLIPFLQSIPGKPLFNIIGNIASVTNYNEILSHFDQRLSLKNMVCSYKNVIAMQPTFEKNFSYRITVQFPIDMQQWNNSRQLLLTQTLAFEYLFDVTSNEDCQQVEKVIEQFSIEKYQLNPRYTGYNIKFFEENVFLNKEDILSTSMSIKDFFSRQSMNIFDFGKISIMPNGDTYANVNHPALGNIYTHSIYEIVHKELEEGKSWFRIRNQVPCNDCVYQWICPPPSNYEIIIGRPNLCHMKR